MGRREIGTGDTAEHASEQQRLVAHGGNADACGVNRARVLADGAQTKAKAGLVDDPGNQGDDHGCEVDDDVMTADQLRIDQPYNRHISHGLCERQCDAF